MNKKQFMIKILFLKIIVLIFIFQSDLLCTPILFNINELREEYFKFKISLPKIPRIDVPARIKELAAISNPTYDDTVELISLLMYNGQLHLAEDRIDKFFINNSNPIPIEAYYVKAKYAFCKGRFKDCEAVINEGLLKDQDNIDLLEMKAMLEYFNKGDILTDSTIKKIRMLKNSNKAKRIILTLKYTKALYRGNYAKAYRLALKSMKYVNRTDQIIDVLVDIYSILRQTCKMKESEKMILSMSNNILCPPIINIMRAYSFCDSYKYIEAKDEINKLMTLYPDNEYVLMAAAYIELKEGFIDKAKEYCGEISKMTSWPEFILFAEYVKAISNDARNDNNNFINYLQQYPNTLYGLQLAVSYFITVGKYDEAEIYINKILKINPRDYMALIGIAFLNFSKCYWERAKDQTELLLRYFPQSDQLYKDCIIIWIKMGNLDESQKLYNKAFKRHILSPDLFMLKGEIELLRNNPVEAENYYKEAIKIVPEKEYYYDLGYLYIQQKQWKKALSLFKKIEKMKPINMIDNYFIYKIYDFIGDKKNAILYKDKYLTVDEKHQHAYEIYWNLLIHVSNGRTTWSNPFIVKEKRYVIITTISKEYAEFVSNKIKKTEMLLKKKVLNDNMISKISDYSIITIYKDMDECRHRMLVENDNGNISGHYMEKYKEGITFYQGDLKTASIACHEFAHFIINSNFKIFPDWLQEGIAEYVECMVDKGEKIKLLNVLNKHKDEKWPSVENYVSSQPTEKNMLFYARSWKLIDTLLNKKYVQKWRELLKAYSSEYNGSNNSSEIFFKIYSNNLNNINSDWRK